jgi:hypothetical protein
LIYFKNQVNDELKVLWGYGQSLYEEQIPNVEIRYIEGLPSQIRTLTAFYSKKFTQRQKLIQRIENLYQKYFQ